ncbi:MAG: flagellar basal body protein, partial [Oscillospiraceae bacterium]|nr:flagellar basal body protein [Oscillospiraceae bacterium]
MAILGTFSTFTTARLGIYASQSALQVTGNNIANINTKGYTRQRLDLYSLNSTGLAHYANPMGVDIGYGVLVKSTTQVRDPYLDIRFRNENTKLGASNATLAGLNKISQTLDEVNKGSYQNGVLEDALMGFVSSLRELAGHVGSEEYDGLVREAAKTVTTFLNTAANNLQDDWNLQADELRDTVKDVNACLNNIRNLNEQIRKQGIYGDLALELRDARNVEIDKLSEYLDINVEYSLERIDQYSTVEKLTISLKNTQDPNGRPGEPIKLIDGIYGAQLSFSEKEINPKYNPNEDTWVKKDQTGAYNYLDAYGKGTNDIRKAFTYRLNPVYDPAVTGSTKYIDMNGKAMVPDPNPGDDIKVSDKKYMEENGLPTDDEDKAVVVDPNKFLFQVERLEDKYGNPMDEGKYTESVAIPLDDNDLYGSLQAMRELLIEEGEFASKKDVNKPDDTDKPLTYSELRASDPNANIKKGIPYYQKRLDLLAQKFAEVFNEANQLPVTTVYETQAGAPGGGTFVTKDKDGNVTGTIKGPDGAKDITWDDVTIEVDVLDSAGNPVDDPNNPGTPLKERIPLDSVRAREALRDKVKQELGGNPTDEQIEAKLNEKLDYADKCLECLRRDGQLKEEYEFYDGGVLFSSSGNTNNPAGITAGNISIANSWANRTVRVLNTKKPDIPAVPDDPDTDEDESRDPIRHSSESDNISHMVSLFEMQMSYKASELEPNAAAGNQRFFHGSFQEMYTDLGATLGSSLNTVQGVTDNYEILTLNMDNNRLSVSGVDLNDEATDMM